MTKGISGRLNNGPLKESYKLTPRTCECYLYLYSKRDFAEVTKMGGLSWVIWTGTDYNHKGSSKREERRSKEEGDVMMDAEVEKVM